MIKVKKMVFFVSVVLLVFAFSSCYQQNAYSRSTVGNYHITGVVRDKNNIPIEGVSISFEGLSVSSLSNGNGEYILKNVSGAAFSLVAKKQGYMFIPAFENQGYLAKANTIYVAGAADGGIVKNANFIALQADALKIADIQGAKARSPLEGTDVSNVVGVVTMVCRKTAHAKYDSKTIDGSTIPQWISEDGFFMEALPSDKDLSGKKSNGIFVSTHDDSYTDSKWIDSVPTDLKAGDIVAVSGRVIEKRPVDRFNNSQAYLTRTDIKASVVLHRKNAGINETAAYPDGVLLTYTEANATAWLSGNEHNGKREARLIPFDDSDLVNAQQNAIDVMESAESMVVRIDTPLVVGGTYYNLTGVLADDGKKNGVYGRTFNEDWGGCVVAENDFNAELLFVDYQAPDWTTFKPLAQMGDHLKDSTSAQVFRGVLDYTDNGLYMAHPLQEDGLPLSVTGETIPKQGFGFINDAVWYKDNATIKSAMEKQNLDAKDRVLKEWRCGTKTTAADPKFVPAWGSKIESDDSLTFASFNIENYENQGQPYGKDMDIALAIKNNLLYPDVLVIVEMGDDTETPQHYANQPGSWAPKDGSITAVKNYSTIIDSIRSLGGPEYEFRQIDPKEQDSGGKPGVNIRVGFMYNTDRVEFVDAGLKTNFYKNTHTGTTLNDASEWDLKNPGVNTSETAPASVLADAVTAPYKDAQGNVHLSQSPSYIHARAFERSRRPLIGEFIFKPSNKIFFAIAAHQCSKRGDMPLYGEVQPPLLLSEVERNSQGEAINEMVDAILALDSSAKIIVAGDMNDFAFGMPMKVLTGEAGGNPVLWSPSEKVMPQKEQFSYSFHGNLQQIDHIFVTKSIWDSVEVAARANWKDICFIPHINSPFCRNNHLNLSDHDPEILHLKGAF